MGASVISVFEIFDVFIHNGLKRCTQHDDKNENVPDNGTDSDGMDNDEIELQSI